jgi:hypothetical protein
MLEALKALLRSRKFLLAAFGVIQALVLHYANVPPEVWQSIVVLVTVVIAGIAYEDGQQKRATVILQEPDLVEDPEAPTYKPDQWG